MKALCKRYVIFSAALLLFGAVYERFSYGVYSAFMLGAFLIPLLLGALPSLLLQRLPPRRQPGEGSRWLWGAGLTTLTAGSLFRGVMEIYGTTSRLGAVYWIAGAALCLAGAGCYVLSPGRFERMTDQQ